ncbi:SWI/SNF and RSC complex subunit Ssr3 [Dispira parvispora]|uniref:SWI/SNF and RSC complex subunit Ssr3 n=1 Tax=Dispira parvispora TaxID=1520584 RepID=A0A9W8AUY4_9FUNG|nr:SWI/SNF and RSC complex subunit Ssr3 [Dispira parvispora]
MDAPTVTGKRKASESQDSSSKPGTPATPGMGSQALSMATTLNTLPAALASAGINAHPNALRRVRVTDRQLPADLDNVVPESRLFTDLQALERRLDATILRKRLELQEAKGGNFKMQRTLRIFVSNTVANQPHQVDDGGLQSSSTPSGEPGANTTQGLDVGSVAIPSWTLRIEGRLLELPYAKKITTNYKFSSFFESVVVETLRDPKDTTETNHPDGEVDVTKSRITEWKRTPNQSDTDGFEIKRSGDVDVPVRIILTPRPVTNHFRLSQDLAEVLGLVDTPELLDTPVKHKAEGAKQTNTVTMTKVQVITQLWHYIRHHKLQNTTDPQRIHSDPALRRLFGVQDWSFPLVSHLLAPHLLPPEPVVIHYTIRVNPDQGNQSQSPYVYDLQVEVDDLARSRTYGYQKAASLHNQINHIDEQLIAQIRGIQNSQQKRQFLLRFSQDPARFIHRWVEAQARELDTIAQERSDLPEMSRRSKYFQEPWLDEAVFYYLGTQNISRNG